MQWPSTCLVRSNAAALEDRAPRFADDFLDRFVRQCPELSRALTWNREERRRELMETFAGVLRQAPNAYALGARLTLIAAANVRKGVRPHHYHQGREILLELLSEYNGHRWNPALARAWEDLLDRCLFHLAPPQSFDEAIAA